MPTYASTVRRPDAHTTHSTMPPARQTPGVAMQPMAHPQAAMQTRLASLAQRSGQTAQWQALQAKADAWAVHGTSGLGVLQRQETGDEHAAQRASPPSPVNHTGLPAPLKAGIESLSGMAMDHVKVHYNASRPAQFNALAYAQGSDIHVAPGQEKHLPHEAWHVVQQAQGRVKPTRQMQGGMGVNDDKALEREANVMGARAASLPLLQSKSSALITHFIGQAPQRETTDKLSIQCISEEDARARLNVRNDDTSAANAVAIIDYINQIFDDIPILQAALATYPEFLGKHVRGNFLVVGKSYLNREVSPMVAFITEKLASYIEVLEGIEDWYTEASPIDRNNMAEKYIETWRSEAAVLRDNIAPIRSLFAEEGTIYETSEVLSNGIKSLAGIKGILTSWLTGGGGFSALGRATNIPVEIVKKGTGSTDKNFILDNHVFSNYLLGQGGTQNAGNDIDVYKANQREMSTGPLIVMGRNRTIAENADRETLLTEAEEGMSAVKTYDEKTFTATPASQDRGKGQHAAMNNTNARGYAWLLGWQGWDSSRWEWLHIRAASLGGATNSTNLILGTRDANTQMMPFESNVKTLGSLVHQHPHLKNLHVHWSATNKYHESTVQHSYKHITIFWVVEPEANASNELKEKAANAGGTAIFDVLHTESILSKTEVQRLEKTLSTFRQALQPEEV